MAQFRSVCAGGGPDPLCDCMATALPPVMTFAAYRGFVAASRFEPGAKLDDETLRKMAHAATQCAAPFQNAK